MALKARMLCYVMGTLVVGVLLSLAFNIGMLLVAFPDWIENVADSMTSAEELNLGRISTQKADWSGEYFDRVIGQAQVLAKYTDDVMDGVVTGSAGSPENVEGHGFDTFESPGWDFNMGTQGGSLQYSAWWMCSTHGVIRSSCGGVDSAASLGGQARARYDKEGPLSVAFKALVNSGFPVGPSFLGIAFEDDGLLLSYPYLLDPSLGAFSYTCSKTNSPKVGYDPRCRGWYTQPFQQEKTILSSPYTFTDGTVGVTVGVPISTYPGSDQVGTPAGIAMADFTIGDVTKEVGGTKVLSNGFGFLTASDGSVLVHPDYTLGVTQGTFSLVELEFPGATSSAEAQEFVRVVATKMNAGEKGTATYTKGGKKWFAAFAPVPGAGYSLGVAVPEDDIQEPFINAQSSINATVVIVVLVVTGCIGLVLFFAFGLASKVANDIVRPVQAMNAAIKRINRGQFSGEVVNVQSNCKELGLLFNVFQQMFVVVKFGNSSFEDGAYDEALNNYEEALQLFRDLQNQAGIGVALNNIGNIHFMLKNYGLAAKAYEGAVNITTSMLLGTAEGAGADDGAAPAATLSEEEQAALVKQRANRSYNLALVLQKSGDPRARHFLLECIESWAHIPGLQEKTVLCWIDLATMDAAAGDFASADIACKKAAEIAASGLEAGPATDRINNRITIAFGELAAAEGHHLRAIFLFEQVLQRAGPKIDRKSLADSVNGIKRSALAVGEEGVANSIGSLLTRKDIVFSLDYSGSMAGSLNRSTVAKTAEIIETYVQGMDRAGLLIFNRAVERKFWLPASEKAQMLSITNKCTNPRGGTAFFDSIIAGLDMLAAGLREGGGSRVQWLVALTDGDDNSSSNSLTRVLSALRAVPDVGLIVIVVGQVTSAVELSRLCDPAQRGGPGVFIHAAEGGSAAVSSAFAQVSELISGAEVSVESY